MRSLYVFVSKVALIIDLLSDSPSIYRILAIFHFPSSFSLSPASRMPLSLILDYAWDGSCGEHPAHSPGFDTKLPSQGYELLLDISSFLTQPWWSVTWSQGSEFTHDLYSHMNSTSWKLHCLLFSAGKSLGNFHSARAPSVRHANEANKRLIWWKYMRPVWVLFNNEQRPNPLTLKTMKRANNAAFTSKKGVKVIHWTSLIRFSDIKPSQSEQISVVPASNKLSSSQL